MYRKRPGWARTTPVNATAEELKTLLGALTSSEEARRREAVTNVLARAPELRRHLADRLVGRLTDRRAAVRRQAEASLVGLGAAAGTALFLGLLEARSAELREQLVRIVFRIAQALPEEGDPCRKLNFLATVLVAATPPSWFRPRRRRRPAQMGDGAA